MSLGLALAAAALVVPALAAGRARRLALPVGAVLLAVGVVHDAAPVVDLGAIGRGLERVGLLGLDEIGPSGRMVLVGALLWSGPAADIVVRQVLEATRLPAPETAAEAGLKAGRWIGRLERWLLVVCIAGGQAALAVLPIGGKALFRYAEVVAEARIDQPRLQRADGDDPPVTRGTLIDYVIVGSLASWVQAIVLAILAASSTLDMGVWAL